MKPLLPLLALLVLCFLAPIPADSAPAPLPLPPPVDPEPDPLSGRYPVLVALPDQSALAALYALDLDLAGLQRLANGARLATVFVDPSEASWLTRAGLAFVPIPNQDYRSYLAYGPSSEAATPWPSFEAFAARLQAIEAAYPNLARLSIIGYSVQGRPLYCLQLSDNPGTAEDEPEFRYLSTMHGGETTGIELTLRLAELLTAGYGADPALTALVDGLEIWLCPIYNPDGYAAGSRYNANGVDLNRDYPDRFTDPLDDPAGHEPETQAFMNFSYQHRFVMGANYHGGTLVVNYPWDAIAPPDEPYQPIYAPDDELFYTFGLGYTSRNPEMYASESFEYGLTPGWEWYQVYGGLQDWAYLYRGEHHVTIEVSEWGSPPYDQMDDYWESNREAMLWWMAQAATGFGGRVLDARDSAPLDAAVSVEGMSPPNFARTDPALGDYHRVILPGAYSLRAAAEGYLEQSTALSVTAGALASQDFYLCPSVMVALQGTVTDALSGLPLGASIELLGSPITAASSPLDGSYSVLVCPTQYTLRASAPNYVTEERPASLDESSTQDFALQPLNLPLQAAWLPLIVR